MVWVVGICGVLLSAAAVAVLFRIERGPSTLDRMVGVDVMTSVMLGALALLVAYTRRADLLAVFVVVSVVGFLGSVAVARAARPEDPGKRRILTIEEEQAISEAEAAEEDSQSDEDSAEPVHPDGSDEEDNDG
ncbi:monovalent cation/H+ antiporter complex subunit F [Ancrocorticia populi]|uniref:pH regulation protein F n=1 Tax=Ancrocorticia populi TaxID=2175228 RepID=A0A2V1K4Z5_9ACTO|nr:monovalent cation/H+ antiporter complex subunit F [Ancrocorticia populi]PWF26160.1 pH regulation protein F [Ancrocorticia populi]